MNGIIIRSIDEPCLDSLPVRLPHSLRGMRMVRATVRRQFPLAIGATGVLHRAYGGRGRDGIRETLAHGYGKF